MEETLSESFIKSNKDKRLLKNIINQVNDIDKFTIVLSKKISDNKSYECIQKMINLNLPIDKNINEIFKYVLEKDHNLNLMKYFIKHKVSLFYMNKLLFIEKLIETNNYELFELYKFKYGKKDMEDLILYYDDLYDLSVKYNNINFQNYFKKNIN